MGKKIYHDVTLDFSENIAIYPGDPPLEITERMSIAKGDVANVSLLSFGSHTGTHIDAPKHFIDSGLTVDKLPLDHFMGKAKVFEFKDKDAVTFGDIKDLDIKKGDIIIFKTRNSSSLTNSKFDESFAYVAPDAAKYLAGIGIKTLGFDYLSVERYGSTAFETHYALLGSGIVIIEGLYLEGINAGEYEIIALPIKIKNGNGSPVRVVLIEEE